MPAHRTLGVAVLAALCALAPSAGAADEKTTELGLYVWGVSLHGDVDTAEGSSSMHVPFSDLLDNTNLAFMGRFRTEFEEKFSFSANLEYFDLESDREQRSVRIGAEGNPKVPVEAKAEIDMWVGEASLGYEIFDFEEVELSPSAELYAGARFYNLANKLDFNVGGTSGDIDSSKGWVDAIVGARFVLGLSKTVDMGIQGDVGGFDYVNSSEFAWSQITSLSWAFADSWRLHLGYKFLEFKKGSGENKIKLQMRGPFVATSLVF